MYDLDNPLNPRGTPDYIVAGGGGTPEWLPEGALAYADFANNHYYAGGAERAQADIIVPGLGAPPIGEFQGEFLAAFQDVDGFTVVYSGVFDSSNRILQMDTDVNLEIGVYTDPTGLRAFSMLQEVGDAAAWLDGVGKFALTVTPTKMALADRGILAGSVALDTETEWGLWVQVTTPQGIPAAGVVIVYPPQLDADLPALSALA